MRATENKGTYYVCVHNNVYHAYERGATTCVCVHAQEKIDKNMIPITLVRRQTV